VILLRLRADADTQWVAVFGIGLIGSSLVSALKAQGAQFEGRYRIAWNDPKQRSQQLATIETTLATTLASTSSRNLQVVWSAGQCGFEASQGEADQEQRVFDEVLMVVERVARDTPGLSTKFLMIGSAGGLFEGQRHVDRRSRPDPHRAYGRLKLYQEERIRVDDAPWTPEIVRLTSVVGPLRHGQRQGLISTLVWNGLRRLPTGIVGRMETLRDFISVDDVAAFLALRIRNGGESGEAGVMTLASFRPASLAEVQRLVERVLGRRLFVSYALAPSNDMNITFSPDLRPAGWSPRDLLSSVRGIYRDALARGPAD